MKKKQITFLLGMGAALLVPTTSANAHFLWGSVTTGAEPSYRLTISEAPLEDSDAEHDEQAREASAWHVGGKNLKLSHRDAAFFAPLDKSAKLVAAGYSWGVFPTRAKDGKSSYPYLLDLYAKTAVSEAAAAESANLPLEVFARRDGQDFIASVKAEGKPLAKAAVVVVAPDEKEEKTFTTDAQGRVRFAFTKEGLYTVRAIDVVTKRSGAHNGKWYTAVHGYSTLTFTAAP